ncbi:unnamed protein product, partial [Prorocentrum cordatum]
VRGARDVRHALQVRPGVGHLLPGAPHVRADVQRASAPAAKRPKRLLQQHPQGRNGPSGPVRHAAE